MHLFIAIVTYLIGIFWIAIWAYRRSLAPLNGQIPQSDWDLAARFIYVIGYLVSFIGFTGFLVFGGELATKLIESVAASQGWLEQIKNFSGAQIAPVAPLFAVGAIQLGLKIAPIGNLDARVLAWLHSVEHLEYEVARIREALIQRDFRPNEEEVGLNHRKLQAHDIRLTERGLIESDLELVTLLRKSSCLLRYVALWDKKTPGLLDDQEKSVLKEIESADKRKIEHAVDIIKALTLSGRTKTGDTDSPKSRPAILAQSGAPLVYRTEDETVARGGLEHILPANTGTPYAVELDPSEFLNAIEKIQGYFIKEYDIMLERICSLAAKSIVHSGHDAEVRINSLKDAGFCELGSLNRLNIDKIIKFFCFTMMIICFSAILFFVLGQHGGPDSATIIKLGLAFGFTILCGAMIGSNRALAKRQSTPWAAFIGAGFMSFVLFLLVFFSFSVTEAFIEAVKSIANETAPDIEMNLNFGQMEIRGNVYPITLHYLMPWTLVPVFSAIAICCLSRSNPICRGRLDSGIGDGLALGAIMALVMAVSLAFHVRMETAMLHRLYVEGVFQPLTALQGLTFFAFLGLLIGYFIIPDVRKIAQSRI